MAKKIIQGTGGIHIDAEIQRASLIDELWDFQSGTMIQHAMARRDYWITVATEQEAIFVEHFGDELPVGVNVDKSLVSIDEIEVGHGGQVNYTSTSSGYMPGKGFTLNDAAANAKREYERARANVRKFHRYFELFKAHKDKTFHLTLQEVEDFGIFRYGSPA